MFIGKKGKETRPGALLYHSDDLSACKTRRSTHGYSSSDPGANQLGHFGQGSTDKQRTRSEKLDFGFGANLYPSSSHSDQPAIPLTLVP